MQLLKPVWVRHEEDKPIFSVDIHPKGGRFATGGQGGQGGRIVIWNIGPVLSQAQEDDVKVPKQLCQMDNHLACVNIVRWSCKGHLLASGSDDKLVMIWKLTGEGSSTIFGGGGKVNVESWKCMHTLNAHSGDVLDLAWAPHDGWLASASVDNTVIIWNTHKFPEKVSVLKGHTAMVKGVSWDPVGKYLATQSDDKTLRVWRTADWHQQELVRDGFSDCSATTHVLRCSWSPDGQYLVSAHAMNGGGPTALIIERDGWKQDKDFVGHRKAVTCVRFDGNILKKWTSGTPPKEKQYCCCAIGSRDRSISVWLTSLQRPLVVIKDLFDDSVLDISWGSDGLHLLACSWDGTVACVIFDAKEIGTPLTEMEKNSLYEKTYGKPLHRNLLSQSFTGGSQIIENAEMLVALDELNAAAVAQQQAQAASRQPRNNQPVEVESSNNVAAAAAVTVVVDPISCVITGESVTTHATTAGNKQIETRLPGGKRRITPMFVRGVPTTPMNIDNLDVCAVNEGSAFSSSSPTKSKIVVIQESSNQSTNIRHSIDNNKLQARSLLNQMAPLKPPTGVQINQLMCTEVPGDQPIVQFINVLDPIKLPPGQMITKKNDTLKLQVTNACVSTSRGSLAKIEVFKKVTDKQAIWETYLGSTIRCIQCNHLFIIACCEDLTVNCYRVKSGERCLPPLVIEDVVSGICLSDEGKCLVLTKTGLLHMWDLHGGKALLSRISLRSLLSNKASVSGCSLSSTDLPIISLNDGRAFSYSTDLQTWVLLSNPLDPLSHSSSSLSRALPANLPLSSLQRHPVPTHSSSSSLPAGVLLSHLECQLTAAHVLHSSAEFKHWLLATVNHLLDRGPEVRLRAVLDELLGATHGGRMRKSKVRGEGEGQMVLGLSKSRLLEEVLAIIKTKIPWQRLYKEYTEQLQLISKI